MTPIRLIRSEALTITEQVDAVFRSPVVYELGSLIPIRQPVGRPANNPPWLLLAYGVLARVFRSAVHVEVELARPDMWQRVREVVAETSAAHPELAIPEAGLRPPTWDAWRSARNTYFAHPEVLGALRTRFRRK